MSLPEMHDIDGVTWQPGNTIKVNTQPALDAVMVKLLQMGYELDDSTRRDKSEPKGPWLVALASYPRLGKCGSCNGYIETRGIGQHGHNCELCGAVTHFDLTEDSRIRFCFRDGDFHASLSPELVMEVKRWDDGAGELYLKPGFINNGNHLFVVDGEEAQAYLDKYPNAWELVQEGAEQLLKVRYSPHGNRENDTIERLEQSGEVDNYQIVYLHGGVEYELPIPRMISIHATF